MESDCHEAGRLGLAIRHLNVYYGPAQAVFDLSLDVPEGDVLGLCGRNGAGKTSTILGILGLGVRRTGEIHLSGKRLSRAAAYKLARGGLGWVPDTRRLIPSLTVKENLRLARARKSGEEVLSDSEVVDLFPLVGGILERSAGVLSGGEQQIVAIARALVRKPSIMLVDEPSEGLAPVVVDQVVEALNTMKAEFRQTLIVAEADTNVLRGIASTIVVLSIGRVVYAGLADEFFGDLDLQNRLMAF